MSKIIFNEFQRQQLENNPNVNHVSDRSISYKPEFKIAAIKEYKNGKGPTDIFIEYGFDLDIIGSKKPQQCLKRWRKTYEKYGEEGFKNELRGKGSTGRPSSKDLTVEDKLKKAEARIAFLEMEKRLLKKVRRTREEGEETKLTLSEKFQLIEATIRRYGLVRMVSYLCELATVKRKSYYAWLKAEPKRIDRERKDVQDYKLIKQVFDEKNGKSGGRDIRMVLENDYFTVMNLKKIYRIMNKFNLESKIRRSNPYKRMAQATQEHRTRPNILNRNFVHSEPGKVLLTDITYLYLENGIPVYLSCVKDGSTREILAYYLSTTLEMRLVYRTLDNLINALDGNVHPEAILHSDQGFHYTNPEYRKKVKKLGFIQSMSRKGNCWDNAPIESFFGHLKDEIDASSCQTLTELKGVIEDYMVYYNTYRYQWGLKKMAPEQYRSHLLSA
ncbi:IS3 family transposase [Metabacillus elymi]|uniref:IS3 family transposase n=1 Tax=Metabacillus elymi TaxID=2745198 RepID=A0ABX6S0Q2_9BACI|nr:IS3 family transposase [Metabacillus sp. KUDC1714]QNF26435.1 IS3 family transposase [Metabacillus sp. KUDC1714]